MSCNITISETLAYPPETQELQEALAKFPAAEKLQITVTHDTMVLKAEVQQVPKAMAKVIDRALRDEAIEEDNRNYMTRLGW